MNLYAVGEDDLVFAPDAEPGKEYSCLDCFGPVRMRRGRSRFPHFYHLRPSPQCRLYSKTEDHLRAQIQLQKFFPEGELQMERPFPKIGRVADLCWEKEKIVFEIQCSPVSPHEAESRISDYKSAGYRAVWLLDDKRYNGRVLRPAEEFLRKNICYYIDINHGLFPDCYDQFEVHDGKRRLKRGRPLKIDLRKPKTVPKEIWDPEKFPAQILHLTERSEIHFFGDRIDKARLSFRFTSFAVSMQNWRFLETQCAKKEKKPHPFKIWIGKKIIQPYKNFLVRMIHG